MRHSISEVFEKMFFLFLEPQEGELACGYDMESSIRFDGSICGEVRILLSEGMARSMVQNMLGLDGGEVALHNLEDCSKEAANMICGDFLGKFESDQIFALSTPVFKGRPDGIEAGGSACRIGFCSDEDRVGVIVSVD